MGSAQDSEMNEAQKRTRTALGHETKMDNQDEDDFWAALGSAPGLPIASFTYAYQAIE
jgi:hypothetical protein